MAPVAYTPTPAPPAREPDQPVIYYGARLVNYITEHETAAQLSDDQLETAAHAITWLLSRQPEPDEQISPCYFSGLRHAEETIERTRRYRAAQAENLRAALADAPQAAQGPTSRDGGSREPARPFPPRLPSPSSVATPYTRTPQPAIDF
jgi:AraC-like DNA-binding protein